MRFPRSYRSTLLVLAMAIFPGVIQAELSDSDKAKYAPVPYPDAVAQRKKLAISAKTRNVTFKILFTGLDEGIPRNYDLNSVMKQRYWKIKFSGEDKKLPLLFNSRKALKGALQSLSSNTPIKVYGKLVSSKKGKNKVCFVDVEAVEQVTSAVTKMGATLPKDAYKDVEPLRLEIRYADYIDKPVKIQGEFKGIRNAVANTLASAGLNGDDYFTLFIKGFGTPIIVSRHNAKCVEPIISANPGEILSIYGVLRVSELKDRRGTQKYIFLGADIVENKGPAPR